MGNKKVATRMGWLTFGITLVWVLASLLVLVWCLFLRDWGTYRIGIVLGIVGSLAGITYFLKRQTQTPLKPDLVVAWYAAAFNLISFLLYILVTQIFQVTFSPVYYLAGNGLGIVGCIVLLLFGPRDHS